MRELLVVGRAGGGRYGSPVIWGDGRGAVGVPGGAIENAHSVSGGSGGLGEGRYEDFVCAAAWEMS